MRTDEYDGPRTLALWVVCDVIAMHSAATVRLAARCVKYDICLSLGALLAFTRRHIEHPLVLTLAQHSTHNTAHH